MAVGARWLWEIKMAVGDQDGCGCKMAVGDQDGCGCKMAVGDQDGCGRSRWLWVQDGCGCKMAVGDQDGCGRSRWLWEIKMAVGARVMLQRNIGTEGGLVVGGMGTVVGFEWPEAVPVDNPERQPAAMNVLLDNKRVGRLGRQFALEREGSLEAPVPHTPVAIIPATAKFMTKNKRHHLERYQLPLELAWAMTIHRVQGLGKGSD